MIESGRGNERPLLAAILVAIGYYCGAMIGFALTFGPLPISVLWPPNSILLGALLLTPPRWWWLMISSAFPAHLAAEMQSGVPAAMVLAWFASNCSEALIGAITVRSVLGERLRFDSFRHVSGFIFLCAVLAPFLSSFLDVGLVKLIGWGEGSYWQLWRLRFFSNALAVLAFVPVLLTWNRGILASARAAPAMRRLQGSLWALALLTVSIVVFITGFDGAADTHLLPHVLLYAPLPILLWAAVQFNTFTVSVSFLAVTFLAIWGAIHGHGPFITNSPATDALSIQLFLIGVAVPLLLLSAAMQERRQTHEALRLKEEKLRVALAAARMGTWDWDIRENRGNWSPESKRIFGTAAADISLESFANLVHPVDRSWTMRTISRAVDEGGSYEVEFRIVRPDGEVRWVIGKGAVLRDAAGSPVRMLGVNLDITDRKLAEAAAGREAAMREVQEELERRVAERTSELCEANAILEAEIAQRRRAEEAERISGREAQRQRAQLTHLTRVALLGEFSGALAHELNQPLAAILSNAQAARRFLAADLVDLQEIRDILEDIVDEDKRAGEVIRRLRALFMKDDPKLQPLDLNQLVNEALDLAHSDLITRKVKVAVRLCPDPGVVRGDKVQLQQVLLNLILNACEAMNGSAPNMRELTFHTEAGSDGNVWLAISDTGCGIPADAFARLFDSFFTTKVRGLGFGLSISRSIVTEHGGRIEATNNPNGGATFRITLPFQTEDRE
jgi:PAS domain S-box-containing protein